LNDEATIDIGDLVTVATGGDNSYIGDVFRVVHICGQFVVLHGVVTRWGAKSESRLALKMGVYEFQKVDVAFVTALGGSLAHG
jgi:hypothetical protein